MPPEGLQFVEETVRRLGRGRDAVIPILQALQEHYRYLPEPALRRVCEEFDAAAAEFGRNGKQQFARRGEW